MLYFPPNLSSALHVANPQQFNHIIISSSKHSLITLNVSFIFSWLMGCPNAREAKHLSGWADGMLADSFEALLAALFMDRGFNAARALVMRLIEVRSPHAAGPDMNDLWGCAL